MNYYDILGIDKSATPDEIKKAFRRKSMETHPDRGGDESKFREVSEAYEVLSDEGKKAEYDRFGSVGGGGNRFQTHGFSMEDIFSQFSDVFGGGSRYNQYQVRKGQDLRVQLNVTLEDVFAGGTKKIKYKRQTQCKPCNGKGGTDVRDCPSCRGTGQRTTSQQTPFGMFQQTVPCTECNYTGKKVNNKCNSCKGDGTVLTDETVEINVPKGVSNGITLKMSGYGNHIRDGHPGDLHVVISESRHPKFRREGNDLYCEEWITIPEAVLGTKIGIDTLAGRISVDVQPGSESGKTFSFPGKGTPQLMGNGSYHGHGTLFVRVHVTIPKKITEEEANLYNQLRNI